jgi:SAM-dependent methyltransferase
MASGQVNDTLLRLIFKEPIEHFTVLDVGCGSGALTFAVAKRAKQVFGIDISKEAIEEAERNATDNTSFFVMDADSSDYTTLGGIDMVVSHLCMSDNIIENGYKALPKKGVFAFACFHREHLIEGGRRSRFSYTKDEMAKVLKETGFVVEYLEVEKRKIPFQSKDEAIEILGEKTVERWRKDGRLEHILDYIKEGGRHLTKSILVGKARKLTI